jgi:adenylate cyclase
VETGDLRRALVRRGAVAGAGTAVLILGYYQQVGRLPPGQSRIGVIVQNVVLLTLAVVALTVLVDRWLRRALATDDPTAVVQLPWRLASHVWVLSLPLAVIAPIDDVLRSSWRAGAAEVVGILLGTTANAAFVYLTTERLLRPAIARALAGADTTASATFTAGVRRRLLVAWMLGSGVPLLGVIATPVVHQSDDVPLVAPMIYLGVLGLAIGLVMTLGVARSIAEPLAAVRGGLRRVQAGDVDVDVPVDDAGEIGQLQAGVNAMVEGLRQRRVLEDLFGRHVGPEVARRALERGVSLGGELREVSVCFVDLIGSTQMAEALSAQEVVAVVNRFLAAVVETVTAEGGWVNKFEGDGALCVFGAPDHLDDHAARALRAAAGLHHRFHVDGIDAGIGLSSGEAVAGNVGTESRYEYTVIGRPVNEAARLTDLAKRRPARVLAAAATVALAGDTGWADAGMVELRGVRDPVPVCEPA